MSMEYEKKYKEALERAKNLYENANGLILKKWIVKVFPELQESEDEKISKEIIEFLEQKRQITYVPYEWTDWLKEQGKTDISINWHDVSEKPEKNREVLCEWVGSNNCIWHDVTFYNPANEAFWNYGRQVDYVTRWCYVDDIEKQNKQKESPCDRCRKAQPSHSCQDITALGRCYLEHEKQDEQKLVNKVEPKFKVGDWIIGANNVFKVISLNDELNYYIAVTLNNEEVKIPYHFDDEQGHMYSYHLWTIQDAKDGDVLVASDNSIFIFAGVVDGDCKYYAALTSDHTVQINKDVEGGYWETAIAVHPATKEQCDILMKAMDDTGYTFNFELKKIVQKPMPEPIFRIGDTLRRKGKDYTFIVDRIQGGYYHCDHNNGAFFPIEEQDEWELVDKVEPKFKVGDIVKHNKANVICKVLYANVGFYRLINILGGDEIELSNVEKNFHLWTIKDAKEGDVLASDNGVIILVKESRNSSGGYRLSYHCAVLYDGTFEHREFHVNPEKFVPATKEQREKLEKAMADAGYEWDANKKMLKKIEQKHVCTPKFNVEKGEWYVCTQTFVLRGAIVVIKGQVYKSNQNGAVEGEDKHLFIDTHDGKASNYFRPWTIQDAKDGDVLAFNDNTIVLFKDLYNKTSFHSYCHIEDDVFTASEKDDPDWWPCRVFEPTTQEQRELFFQKMKDAGYEWNAEKKELKKVEQEYHCNGVREPKEATGVLKQIINEQNNTWSEEDEGCYNSIIEHLKYSIANGKPEMYKSGRLTDWLHSLKERYTWKPSKEQMDALDEALGLAKSCGEECAFHIRTLYEQLKKLKA